MTTPAVEPRIAPLEAKRARRAFYGPAFVAAVAYVDPGNFATNFQAGAKFGYLLVWVLVAANLVAVFVQYLSAKIGLAAGEDLPTLCRRTFPRSVTRVLWVQAELVAMATDLAEFVGAAVGLNLLFGVPLFPAGLATAAVSFAVLALQRRGYRPFELVTTFLLTLVAFGFLYQLCAVGGQSATGLAAGMVPRLAGTESLTLSVGIIGATVMPHVIYLHSALTAQRTTPKGPTAQRAALRGLRTDCATGLGLAGLINLAMLCVAVALFHRSGSDYDGTLQAAHDGLGHTVGGLAALAFSVALLAAGLSSSGVGTYAGQIVMQGFIRRRIPLLLRRGLTMAPALIVLGTGVSPDSALILSQVVLSFGIPFALVPLVLLTRRRDVMGNLANKPLTTGAGVIVAILISGLNLYLLGQIFTG
ncbi:Nramp family divalent metal transporter [Streptomyces celluloflavus]|uniref:Nramp family divalent metal transporter n=1 Tax=Streptomyces celluloflavus TaxID=58344 RepID=A0ABW7RT20_9ACTN|nr:Nramp family divalent metal transporter [Streptomyces celluloflavus]WSK17164.1 Nramp family divalent metal transporter [Streptomyces celluloflavus]